MNNKSFSVFLFFFSFFLPLFLLSCSNSAQEHAPEEELPTLRYAAKSLYDSTIWTEELEHNRLTSDISAVPRVSSRINLSPLVMLAANPSDSEKVFPSLASFGSLDTSLISKNLREVLSSFAEAISKNKPADSFMVSDCIYSLALFYIDFNRIFAQCFELDKSQESEPEKSESEEAPAEAGKEGESPTEVKAEETVYFTSFVIGQPFLDGVCYEVPLKFFGEKATLTLSVFCAENSGSWKIDQVQIADWEIF